MVPSGLELCSKITQTNLCTRSLAGRLLSSKHWELMAEPVPEPSLLLPHA